MVDCGRVRMRRELRVGKIILGIAVVSGNGLSIYMNQ